MKPTGVPFTQESRDKSRWYLSKFVNTYGTQFPNIEADYAALWQIIEMFNCKSVLEIGTWEGYATLFMWLHPNIERAVAVDICRNYGEGAHENLAPENYGRYFRYSTFAQLIVGNSDDLKFEKEFDFVFIDGGHSEEQATRDLYTAKKVAKKVVAYHDWWNGNPGVDNAIVKSPDVFKVIDGSNVAFTEL